MMKESEPIDWVLFPASIGHLAAGIGVRPELLFSYTTAVLGGLGGPFAYIGGHLGERHLPALPLVLSVRHPGRARHLEQLVLEPVTRFNDLRRLQSGAFDADWFDQHRDFEGAPVRQAHLTLLEHLEGATMGAGGNGGDLTTLLEHRQLFQPSVMINSPAPDTYEAARGSVFDEAPLIVDTGGSLIRRTLAGAAQRDWARLLGRIVEGARSGCDQATGPRDTGPPRLDNIGRTRTPFVIHLPHELTGQSLLHPETAILYETAALIPTAGCGGRLRPERFPEARKALLRYREAVRRVLWSRLDGSGVAMALKKPIPGLMEGEAELEHTLDNLPSIVRRYCGGLYDLPVRLLWTALAIDDPKAANASRFVPGVLQTARWCVDRQIELVRMALEEEEERILRRAAAVMYGKLRSLPCPCKLADLLRRYRQQKKDHHLPVLHFLESQGVAEWKPDSNEIRLLDTQVPEWLSGARPDAP